jgi:acyl-lipid omega-6 desaturase (Delta-12 desaturase)
MPEAKDFLNPSVASGRNQVPDNFCIEPPTRKGDVRAMLREKSTRSDVRGIVVPLFDLAGYLLSVCGVLYFESLIVKLLCSIAIIPIMLSRLQVLGHDLAHKTLARSGWIQESFGRLVMLPTFHNFSIWVYLHNTAHHLHTNVRDKDYVWAPLTLAEYQALSCVRKWIYRVERSIWGPVLWLSTEHFLRRNFFPGARLLGGRKRLIYTVDTFLVIFGAIGLGFLAVTLAQQIAAFTGGAAMSIPAILLLVFVIPWIVFAWLFGWLVYIQHTGPDVPWYEKPVKLGFMEYQNSVTPAWNFPYWFNYIFHFIYVHNVHHQHMRVPSQMLLSAQEEFVHFTGVKTKRFTVRDYLNSLRCCKLFDYQNHCWTDYEGNRTGPTLIWPNEN